MKQQPITTSNKSLKDAVDPPRYTTVEEKQAFTERNPTKLMEIIDNFRERNEKLQDRCMKLEKDFSEKMKQINESNARIVDEQEKKIQEIKELRNKLDDEKAKAEKTLQDAIDSEKALHNAMYSKLKEENEEFRSKIITLEAELRSLETFKKDKAEIEKENESLKQWKENEAQALKDERAHLENLYKEGQDKLKHERNEFEEQKRELKLNIAANEADRIKFDQEKNLRHNLLEEIKGERDKILERNKLYRQDLSIKEGSNLELHAINIKQAKKIKELKKEIFYLKNKLSDEVSKYIKEIEFLKYENNAKIAEIEYALNSYKEQLKLKNKEIRNMRALSQMILDQRSDAEHFFLESLDYVKEEIKSRKRNLSQPQENINKDPGRDRDISELDWDEKEKVLRMLLSKINSGVQPPFWRNLKNGSQFDENPTMKVNNEGSRINEDQQTKMD